MLLISGGAGAIVLGGMVLWFGRRGGEAEAEPAPGAMSSPTRLVIGMVLLITGYHLLVWAFPERLTPLQWDRTRWYWLPLAGAAAIIASRWLDRFEADRLSERANDPPPG